MIVLGLLLIAAAALLILIGVFTADVVDGNVELLNAFTVAPEALFLLGVVAGVAVLWGYWVTKFGTKREIAHRRERKKLDELSEKLDRSESDRREESQETGE